MARSRTRRIVELIETEQWWHHCKEGPGVYCLIGLSENLVPASIERVCGPDNSGTLYIGSTRSLHGRLGQLVRTHRDGTGGHRELPEKLGERFPADRLVFCWENVESPKAPRVREAELLEAYVTRFGELPPLNGQA
jgi:hypothetical protein